MLRRWSALLIRLLLVSITAWEGASWLQMPARLLPEQALQIDGRALIATDNHLRAKGENLFGLSDGRYSRRDVAVIDTADGRRYKLRCRDALALCDALQRYVAEPVQVWLVVLRGQPHDWLLRARKAGADLGDPEAQASAYLAMRREGLLLLLGLLALTAVTFVRPSWLAPDRG
jgi:hypothetical protein